MGGRQSKQLKKELAELKSHSALEKLKHAEELEGVKRDKRELEFKLGVLQELTAQAELAAEKANQLALESEERAKALKWELVRKLTVSTASASSRTLSAATSLAAAESSSPRAALNWKLRDGVTLRRSNTTTIPTSGTLNPAKATRLDKQRPHAQSEPVKPQKQVQRSQDPKTNSSQPGSGSSRDDASDPRARAVNNNNNDAEIKASEAAAVLQSVSHQPSSSLSSEDERPPSKYPAFSRKQSARVPTPQPLDESKSSSSEESEPESEFLTRRTRTGERESKAHEADRETKRQESERDESDREVSGHLSRRSRDEEEVLAFSSVDDDSS